MSGDTRYYRPYISSDSESDSDSSTSSKSSSSSSSTRSDNVPNFRAFATQLQLVKTGGPSFSTTQEQIYYHKPIAPNGIYSDFLKAFDPIKPTFAKEGFGVEGFAAPLPKAPPAALNSTAPPPKEKDKQTSIILINSRDRDRTVYVQPTFVRLRLPREYRNIVSFQILQVSLLTSFYYFRPDKFNTDITIYEQNRQAIDDKGVLSPLKIKNYIRQGSYNISALLAEMVKWLNNVPLFFDFVNGFADFQNSFQSTGDFGVNFNEAGDYFYDTLQNDFVTNPTKDFIVTRFWKNRYGGQSTYTIDQVRMAYYYPPLKEIVLDDNYAGQINLAAGLGIDPTITDTAQVQDRIVYTFQGINDPVILALINANQSVLDNYRVRHTFRYSLVNKYNIAIEGQGQVCIFTSPSLNTSLLNLLNSKNAQYYNEQFSINNITSNEFVKIQTSNSQILGVIQDMNIYQQQQFAKYFAIPFNDYVAEYYSHLDWTILTRNGVGAIGIPQGYTDPTYNPLTAKQISENIINPLKQEPLHFFPNMVGLPSTIDTFKIFGEFNHPYIIQNSNINLNSNIFNLSTASIQPSLKGKNVNALIHISASKYTVFEFTSPVRQTLQIETLPRPTEYRVPAYNSLYYDSTIQKFFDGSYAFIDSPFTAFAPYTYKLDNIPQSNIIDIRSWNAGNASLPASTFCTWGLSYESSFSTTSQDLLSINTLNKALYYKMTAPDSNGYNKLTSTFRYQLNVNTLTYDLSGNLTQPRQSLRVLFYKDRGGFMADVSGNRQEYPYNAIASTILSTNMTNIDFPLTVYPKQNIYVTVRPDQTSFGSLTVKVVPYFATGFKVETIDTGLDGINPLIDNPLTSQALSNFNYAKIYDSNFLSLPILSTLWPPDPSIDTSQTIILSSNTPIGYDVSSVSDDYTDYMPFIVGKSTNFTTLGINVGIDPITQYQFESNSPYDVTTQNFFYSGSSNGILLPQLVDVYNRQTVPYRQEKIVHYYSLNYVISGWDVSYYAPYITSNIVQLPYSDKSTGGQNIRGYEYSERTDSNDGNEYLSLGSGPCGFSFIPEDGIWDVDRLVIRSAFTNSNNDPNRIIKYLAVYNMQDIIDKQTPTISMRSSICVLKNNNNVTYDPAQPSTLSGGFDVTGGTYYEFIKDNSIKTFNLNSTIIGYSQGQGTITNDPDNLYSVIAFDSNEKPTTIKALSGSIVPFPYYNTPTISTTFFDGTKAPESFFFDLIIPTSTSQSNFPIPGPAFSSFAPPVGYDGTQSFFSLSQPIGTSVTHYIQAKPFIIDVSGIFAYDLPFSANALVGNVKDYIMTQNTNYQVWYYQQQIRNVTLSWNLNADLIYPPDEQTSILAVAGNTTDYVFLGAKSNSSSNFQLRIKKFNPVSGLLYEYYTLSTFIIKNDIQINTFTYTNDDAFIFSGKTSSNPILYRCTDRLNLQLNAFTADRTANIYHSQDCSSNSYYWLKQDANYNGSTFYQVNAEYPFPGLKFTFDNNTSNPLPTTFRTMAVSLFRGQPYETAIDEILFTTSQDPYRANFFSVYQLNSNTNKAIILKSIVQFSNADVSGSLVIPASYVQTGFNSSRWFMTEDYPYLWANRNNEVDRISRVQSAWQIFYPWQKIVLKKIANNINPIVDLRELDYPEYPHTQMFYYNNFSSMRKDIVNRWGAEQSTNYVVANTDFAGFYFNSYIFTCPLRASANSNDKQYIAIRNYSPTEESHVMVRFCLNNKYTFGYTTLTNIGEEATLYKSGRQNLLFDPNYGVVLSNFDNQFRIKKYWGSNLVPGFPGCNLGFSTYTEFAVQYSNLYKQYNSNVAVITKIVSSVRGNINNYILTTLSNILPATALSRQQYTDPLLYSILWKSALQPNYVNLTENWGLGYNLGFAKLDTPFGTVQRAQSFYKIIDDYIYLRVSPEYDMNKLDFGGRENLSITRDSTGATQTYYGKLLLNNFNALSQTLVQNQVTFSPPIGRIETLSFQWVNFDGTQVNNVNCDWNMSISLSEEVLKAGSLAAVQTGV